MNIFYEFPKYTKLVKNLFTLRSVNTLSWRCLVKWKHSLRAVMCNNNKASGTYYPLALFNNPPPPENFSF